MGRIFKGKSNATGFFITDLNGITVRSSDYREIPRTQRFLWISRISRLLVIIGIALGVATFFKLVHPIIIRGAGITLIIIVAIFQIFITSTESQFKRLKKEASQWHAVEHKVIHLLESGKEVTLENLKKAPMFSWSCALLYLNIPDPWLEEPSDEKLKEGLKVALKYLEVKK
jgi:hypothetical protein